VLAPDAAEDTQTRDGVRTEPDEPAGLLPLVRLPALQRPDDEGEQGDEHRYADEDDEAERERRGEEDDGDDGVAHDRTDHPRDDIEEAAEPHGVRSHNGHDVAGRRVPREGFTHVGAVPADQLDRAERRAQPVVDGEPVPPRAGQRADDAEADERAAPQQKLGRLCCNDALVDRLARRGRKQRLGEHPQDAEGRRDRQGAPLTPAHPAQETQWAAQDRGARMLVRKSHID
jgi:hypothetical protein